MLEDSLVVDSVVVFYSTVPRAPTAVAGEMVSYSLADNNLFTSLLLACFILTIVIFSRFGAFFVQRARCLFFPSLRRGAAVLTAAQQRCQGLLFAVTCLLYAFFYVVFADTYGAVPLTLAGQNILLGVMTAVVMLFFIAKALLTMVVNWVFFDSAARAAYATTSLFLVACEGLFLLPAAFLQTFFIFTPYYMLAYVLGVVIVFRLLTVYEQRQIFFKQKALFLGYIVYLCTLEIAPFVIVWRLMAIISGYLTGNI